MLEVVKNLKEALDLDWKVMVSEHAKPDSVLIFGPDATPNGEKVLIFHPLNYTYFSESDIFVAHEKNLEWIQTNIIDKMAEKALARLDDMVDRMQYRADSLYAPQKVMFLYGTEVTENPDGSFSFYATSTQRFDPPIPFPEEI